MGPTNSTGSALLLESRLLAADMVPTLAVPSLNREREILQRHLRAGWIKSDQMAKYVLGGAWALAVLIAAVVAPLQAAAGRGGAGGGTRASLQLALIAGVALNAAPLILILKRPGWWLTRHTVAAGLVLWSALTIHLCGGRIESHFHVFASLAFIGLYRDWKVVQTATAAMVADHLVRGALWPQSLYGVAHAESWRFFEHSAWLLLADAVVVAGCLRAKSALAVAARHEATLEAANEQMEHRFSERTAQLAAGHRQMRTVVETASAVPWEMAPDTLGLTYIGAQAVAIFGYPREAWQGAGFLESRIAGDDRDRVLRAIGGARTTGKGCELECRLTTAAGDARDVRIVVANATPSGGEKGRLWGLIFDVTEKRSTEKRLQEAQQLETVGRLAAGVTHEIDTPVQFISDSILFVKAGIADLRQLMTRYRELGQALSAGQVVAGAYRAQIAEAEATADLEYLEGHLAAAAQSSIDGLARVTELLRSMKVLSHVDREELGTVDLNASVKQALTIARGEYKYVADVKADYGNVPPVIGFAGAINQLFLNLVVNAAHAIAEAVAGSDHKGTITIATRGDGDDVVVSIGDTGAGVPEAARARFLIADPTGKATAQGLANARAAVERHQGKLTFDSEVGRGTTFEIRLPIFGPGVGPRVGPAADAGHSGRVRNAASAR